MLGTWVPFESASVCSGMSMAEFCKRNAATRELLAIQGASDETMRDRKKRSDLVWFDCPSCGETELMEVAIRPGDHLEALIDVSAPCGLREHWRHGQDDMNQTTTEDRQVSRPRRFRAVAHAHGWLSYFRRSERGHPSF
jgi:hypothetical protein